MWSVQAALVALCLVGAVQCQQEFVFRLTGMNLGTGSKVNGFAKVTLVGEKDCLGRSEMIKDSRNPRWQESFRVRYTPGNNQAILIEVRHHKTGAADDEIGYAYVYLDYEFENPVRIYKDGQERGRVRIERSMEGDCCVRKCDQLD